MDERYHVPVAEQDRLWAGLTLGLVACATGLPVARLQPGVRTPLAMRRAQWAAYYLAHITFGWSPRRVGHVFRVGRETVARACLWVEEARDRPDLDAMLERLERCLRLATSGPVCELGQ